MWIRQLIDTVGFAVQSGAYPSGLERMKSLGRKYAGADKDLASYIDFQTISTEYASKLQPGTDSAKVQEWYLDQLTAFSKRYPSSPEAAQAMLQLALGKEFENNEKEALGYYRTIAKQFRGTDAADKATGAIRRLDSIGKPIDLRGRDLDGKPFALSALRGRPVVIQYWAAWCEPCKQDAKQLRRLQAQFKREDLQIVGVNIDASRQDAAASLKADPMPWTQLFEEGGLESSPLAKQFGVQTLPTMMLVDKSGKLVRHNVTVAELPSEIEQIVK